MILNKQETTQLYRRLAPIYDVALWGYCLLGVRRHRRRAVAALHLRSGDTVVDMGCGTGLSFLYLHEAVGPEERIVSVDLSGAMLEKARSRAEHTGGRTSSWWRRTSRSTASLRRWTARWQRSPWRWCRNMPP